MNGPTTLSAQAIRENTATRKKNNFHDLGRGKNFLSDADLVISLTIDTLYD